MRAYRRSLQCVLEEGDLPLPVKEHEKIARRLERKEREMQALQKELAASKATGERWISRSMAAEARAARAEATGTVLEKQSDSMAAQLQLMKTQKQAAVAAEVGRARELETALAMEGERVRLARCRRRPHLQGHPPRLPGLPGVWWLVARLFDRLGPLEGPRSRSSRAQ